MSNPQTTNVIEFNAHKVSKYLDSALNGFMNDPPDGPYQRGFLAAVLVVWTEAIGKESDARVAKLEGFLHG